MSSTPAVYPTSLVTFTTKVNHIDVVNDDDCNKLQNEVIALQTYIGTNPHGSKNSFADRVNVLLNGSGVLNNSNAFPADTTPVRLFYRNDSETLYVRKYDNSAWQAIGNSPSNVLFQYAAISKTYVSCGEVTPTSFIPTADTIRMRFMKNSAGAIGTAWMTKFLKTSGISTVTFQVELWTNGNGTTKCLVDIGGVVGTALSATNGTAPVFYKSTAMDVSGLGNGTYYDVIVSFGDNAGGQMTFMGTLIGFGS